MFDWGSTEVARFSTTGARLTTYGGTVGEGPGELKTPTDFHVTSDGQVWVLDTGQGRINIYNPDGSTLRHVRIAFPAVRFRVFADKRILLVTLNSPDLFMVTDSLGVEIVRFGRIVSDQAGRGLAVQGAIDLVSAGDFVWAPLYGGYLARFSVDGQMRYFRETVSPSPFPAVQSTGEGGYRVSRETQPRISAYDISADDERIYVLSKAIPGEDARVIDVYASDGGEYLFSMPAPDDPPNAIFVARGELVVVADTTVRKWVLPPAPSP